MVRDLFELDGPQPLVDVLGIGRQLAFQLQEAHRRGRVHGMINVRTIRLRADEWRVEDYPELPKNRRDRLTRDMPCVGNLCHSLAPEQFSTEYMRRGWDPEPPSDLYALGFQLYRLACGRLPYRDVSCSMEAVRAKREGDFVPLRERDPALPAWFTGFIHDLLAVDPEHRPRADEAHRLLKREHLLALLARRRPRRSTPPVPIPEALAPLYDIVRPMGPAGRSGQVWEYLAVPRDGAQLVVLQVSSVDDMAVVQPFVEGESLADRIKRLGPLPVDEVVALGRQLTEALGDLHRRGPHGCLTPERVRIDFDGRAHLTGAFPLATRHPATEVDPLELSPEHLVPEVDDTVDDASDRYGLGLALYTAATGGELPYPGGDRLARLRSKRDGRRVRLHRRELPRRLRRLVDRLLDADPTRRPPLAEVERVLTRC